MGGNLLHSPVFLIVVLVIIVLLFGAPKLPGMARSLGQSMRIFKSEVEGMKSDGKEAKKDGEGKKDETVTAEVVDNGKSDAK